MLLLEMHYRDTLKNLIVSRRPLLLFVLDAQIWIWMRVLELMVPHICIVLPGVHDEIHSCDIYDALRIGDSKALFSAIGMCAV
jgi:hypothetical protein